MQPVEARVKAALERAGYVGRGSLLVVALSGGPDSMALLHSLLSLRDSAGLRLHVAHLNHNFRDEAEEDARFASAVANQLGLPVTVEKADPLAYQRKTGLSSFEAAAREVRYGFLARVAERNGAVALATGHTADDLAETVLMHIIRGSGIHGLRGMEEVSTWRSREGDRKAVLLRPLLDVMKSETAAYCRQRGIAFREDPGNRLMRFTRNRVRHELLPTLESYNPRIKDALVRLAHSSALNVDYLEGEVAHIWPTVAEERDHSIALDSGILASLHPFLRRMMLRKAYQQLMGDTRRLEEVHLKAMEDFAAGPPGRGMDLPRGLHLCTGYGRLIFRRGVEAANPFPPLEGEHQLSLPTSENEVVTEIPGWRISARLVPLSEAQVADPFMAGLSLGAIGDSLRIRTRRPGDRFQPFGMDREKKLQDFYVNEKIPRAWRDRIPLVVSERGIAWVVGHRIAHWARVKERDEGADNMALWIKFEEVTSIGM